MRYTNHWPTLGVLLLFGFLTSDASAGTIFINHAGDAPSNNSVVILASTVNGGASSTEAQAAKVLFDVVINDEGLWGTMTEGNFGSYRAIILGDPDCIEDTTPLSAAELNRTTWSPVITGNMIIIGTDPEFHAGQGGFELTQKGINFAGGDPSKTGAYITLSCYYVHQATPIPVPLLDRFGTGFIVEQAPPLFDDAHIVATHPAFAGLTDSDLSNWGDSVHEVFNNWPVTFQVFAIAENAGTSYTATDGTVGTPYILIRGATVISNIKLGPDNATNPAGTTHTVTATITPAPPPGTLVTFKIISGPNVGLGTLSPPVGTNASGIASKTYTGAGGAGTDLIVATYPFGATFQTSNTVTKTWICPPITLTPPAGALAAPAINTPYSQSLTATGGCGSSFVYTVTSGGLPPGLALSANGVLSGTPTQQSDSTFTVTATDACGCSQSQFYTLRSVDCHNPTACSLKISRFRANGPAGADDEFVEIFNPSDSAVLVSNCSNDPGGSANGIGVFASAGQGVNPVFGQAANVSALVCQIPGNTVIASRGYYLCGGKDYSLGALGNNGGTSHSVPDQTIGGFGIPDDAGLALLSLGSDIVTQCVDGSDFCCSGFNFPDPGGGGSGGAAIYDKVGFGPYGPGSPRNVGPVVYPANLYPSLASQYCEGTCLQPVGDASVVVKGPGMPCLPTVAPAPGISFPVSPGGTIGIVAVCYGESGQYEILRRQTTFNPNVGTLHRDTNNNPDDFILVSPNPATNSVGLTISGITQVTSVLGAAGPHNLSAPGDLPGITFPRAPFAECVDQLKAPNAERIFPPEGPPLNIANDPLGTFTLRFRYTNNLPSNITGLRLRVDDLSTLCGGQIPMGTTATGEARNLRSSPICQGAGTDGGVYTAILKVLNSLPNVMHVCGSSSFRLVNGTVLEDLSVPAGAPGEMSPFAGGIDSSLIVNPFNNAPPPGPSSVGTGVSGGKGVFATSVGTTPATKVLFVQIKFGVVSSGRFKLLITPEGR